MQALLSLSSHVQSVESPSNPSRLQNPNIAMTTLGHFTTSLVDVLTKTREALGEQRDHQAQVCDLRFLRRLMTLWATERDSFPELDRLIENLQVCSSTKNYNMDVFNPNPFSLPASLKSSLRMVPPLWNSTYYALRSC